MLEKVGSLWKLAKEGKPIVVTTNIGWKKDGSNPMGAGVAKIASDRHPELAMWYGKRCKKYGADTAVCYYRPANLFLFPTKPLDEDRPWASWQNDSCLGLIRRSAIQLSKLTDILTEQGMFMATVGLPVVGCGNGNLRPKDVLPILRTNLDDRFVLLERKF